MTRLTRLTRFPVPGSAAIALCAFAALFAAGPVPLSAQPAGWPQWGRTPQHTGDAPVAAQHPEVILAEIVYDPFVEDMKAEADGSLLAHYGVPLVDDTGVGVYMAFKTGTYSGFGNWDTITWTIRKLRRTDAGFETVWTFVSDWKPEPIDLAGWEPVFQPAISGADIYVPGAGGTVFRVDKSTGVSEERVNPFATVDPNRFVAGGLAVAPDGAVIYDVLGLTDSEDTTGGWLVRVEPGGEATSVDFATLVPGAPPATAPCELTFSRDDRPWPPTPNAVPPSAPCGAQRPGLNAVPAIAADGTIYTLSHAHFNDRYGYLVAVHSDLTPAWSASLRGILDDGCGVLVPIDDSVSGCRTGATVGVDPATNDQPAGRVNDQGTSSPVVLPDGAILVGAQTSYNYARGHLLKFSAAGDSLATYDFGWDITPAIFTHGSTYSILIKDNHYFGPTGSAGRYEITSLTPDLAAEWAFPSTQTLDCARQTDGSVECVDDGEHPDGFEWCVNQPAVDANGATFANSEDGYLYALDTSGAQQRALFLDTALGAAYTPISVGMDGVLYVQNNGILFAVGVKPFLPAPRPAPAAPTHARGSTRTVPR